MDTLLGILVFICVLWDAFLTSYIFLRVVDHSKRIQIIERSLGHTTSHSGSPDRFDVYLYVCEISGNGEKEK